MIFRFAFFEKRSTGFVFLALCACFAEYAESAVVFLPTEYYTYVPTGNFEGGNGHHHAPDPIDSPMVQSSRKEAAETSSITPLTEALVLRVNVTSKPEYPDALLYTRKTFVEKWGNPANYKFVLTPSTYRTVFNTLWQMYSLISAYQKLLSGYTSKIDTDKWKSRMNPSWIFSKIVNGPFGKMFRGMFTSARGPSPKLSLPQKASETPPS